MKPFSSLGSILILDTSEYPSSSDDQDVQNFDSQRNDSRPSNNQRNDTQYGSSPERDTVFDANLSEKSSSSENGGYGVNTLRSGSEDGNADSAVEADDAKFETRSGLGSGSDAGTVKRDYSSGEEESVAARTRYARDGREVGPSTKERRYNRMMRGQDPSEDTPPPSP